MSERVTNTKIKKIKKKRTTLTIEQKIEILKKVLKKNDSKAHIAAHYNIAVRTINHIILHKDQLFKNIKQGKNIKRKTNRPSNFIELNNKLYEWYQNNKSTKTITKELLYQETCRIATLTQTKLCDIYNFVKRFMKRYGISESENTNENLQYSLQHDDEANQFNENCTRELQLISIRSRENNKNLNKQLYEWCQKQKASGNTINQQLLREAAFDIAKEVGKPKNMSGFLYQFKKQYKIVLEPINNSEILQNSVQRDDEANQCNAEKFIQEIRQRLKNGNIKKDNIYIMFQVDIIWNTLVATLLLHADKNRIAMQQIDINDLKKKILTFIFCTNITNSNQLFPFQFDLHETNEYENQNASECCESKLLVAHKLQQNVSIKQSKSIKFWYNNIFETFVKLNQKEKKIAEKKEEDKVLLLVDNGTEHTCSKSFTQDDDFDVVFLPINSFSKLLCPNIEKMDQICRKYLLKRVWNFSCTTKFNTEFDKDHNKSWCTNVLSKAWLNIAPDEIEKFWIKFLKEDHQTREEISSLTSAASEKLIKSTGKDIAIDEISIMDISCAESEKEEHEEQEENIDDIKKTNKNRKKRHSTISFGHLE